MKKTQNIDIEVNDFLSAVSDGEKAFISRSLEIANQIAVILDQKNLKQKDLACKLMKSEAEISKWLSGYHNFTLKSLVKLEICLEERIITTPQEIFREVVETAKLVGNAIMNSSKPTTNIRLKETTTKKTPCVIIPLPGKKIKSPNNFIETGFVNFETPNILVKSS